MLVKETHAGAVLALDVGVRGVAGKQVRYLIRVVAH